jgi:hypothetical protein
LPTTRLVNAFIEATKEGPTTAARLPRPGLTSLYTLLDGGSADPGPVLRMFQNPGLFNGDLFSAAGAAFFRNATFVSAIPYTLQPRMAATKTQLALVSGGALYVYDGTSLTHVQYFDDGESLLPPFSSVAVLYNIFVYTVAGTNQFYTSNVGDATTIPALNLSLAQTSPDPIMEVAVLAEELYFFKSKATEIWDYNSAADPAAPFQLSQGRTYPRGTPAQGSVAFTDNALFWVGDNFTVYRTSTTPVRVSTPYIEDILRQVGGGNIGSMTAYNVAIEGHDFYVINLPSLGQSYAYDCQTQEWAQWGSYSAFSSDVGLLAAGCSTGQGDSLFAGSRSTGTVWLWDSTNPTDDGDPILKTVSGALWTTAGKQRLNSVGLACVRGVGTIAIPDPTVRMRMSKDGGRTWGSWQCLEGSAGGDSTASRRCGGPAGSTASRGRCSNGRRRRT